MINHTNREQMIQQYIEGTLSEKDNKSFEALLKQDTTLRNEVAMQREIHASIHEALERQEVEDLFDEIALEKKDFMKKTAKEVFNKHKQGGSYKNLIIVLIIGGALLSSGLWITQNRNKKQENKTVNNKQKEQPLVAKSQTNQESAPPVAPPSEKDNVNKTQKEREKKSQMAEQKNNKKAKVDANKPEHQILGASTVLQPLRRQLDSLPEIKVEQGMGFSGKVGTRTQYRPVYFYNRLPDAKENHTKCYYKFKDTLRIYGQINNRHNLYLLFNPRQGEYQLATPKDTIPLTYKESDIRELKK